VGRQAGNFPVEKEYLSGIDREAAGDLVDERRLAGAVGADEGVHFARGDVEGDAVDGHHAAEALTEVS
jgi:hypothetical protein